MQQMPTLFGCPRRLFDCTHPKYAQAWWIKNPYITNGRQSFQWNISGKFISRICSQRLRSHLVLVIIRRLWRTRHERKCENMEHENIWLVTMKSWGAVPTCDTSVCSTHSLCSRQHHTHTVCVCKILTSLYCVKLSSQITSPPSHMHTQILQDAP